MEIKISKKIIFIFIIPAYQSLSTLALLVNLILFTNRHSRWQLNLPPGAFISCTSEKRVLQALYYRSPLKIAPLIAYSTLLIDIFICLYHRCYPQRHCLTTSSIKKVRADLEYSQFIKANHPSLSRIYTVSFRIIFFYNRQ